MLQKQIYLRIFGSTVFDKKFDLAAACPIKTVNVGSGNGQQSELKINEVDPAKYPEQGDVIDKRNSAHGTQRRLTPCPLQQRRPKAYKRVEKKQYNDVNGTQSNLKAG